MVLLEKILPSFEGESLRALTEQGEEVKLDPSPDIRLAEESDLIGNEFSSDFLRRLREGNEFYSLSDNIAERLREGGYISSARVYLAYSLDQSF